jgi:hypothetical protein
MAYVPYMIGSTVQKIIFQELTKVGYFDQFPDLMNVTEAIDGLSKNVPIKVHDPVLIGIGYITVFSSVFIMSCAFSAGKFLRNQLFISLLSAMNHLSLMLKVGCLLLLRILILPLSLGTCLVLFRVEEFFS